MSQIASLEDECAITLADRPGQKRATGGRTRRRFLERQ